MNVAFRNSPKSKYYFLHFRNSQMYLYFDDNLLPRISNIISCIYTPLHFYEVRFTTCIVIFSNVINKKCTN